MSSSAMTKFSSGDELMLYRGLEDDLEVVFVQDLEEPGTCLVETTGYPVAGGKVPIRAEPGGMLVKHIVVKRPVSRTTRA